MRDGMEGELGEGRRVRVLDSSSRSVSQEAPGGGRREEGCTVLIEELTFCVAVYPY